MDDAKPRAATTRSLPLNLPALILAGGLGTRLRSVLPDLPKLLAPGDSESLERLA